MFCLNCLLVNANELFEKPGSLHCQNMTRPTEEIGPELTMDYSLNNPFDLSHRSGINWCPARGFE